MTRWTKEHAKSSFWSPYGEKRELKPASRSLDPRHTVLRMSPLPQHTHAHTHK